MRLEGWTEAGRNSEEEGCVRSRGVDVKSELAVTSTGGVTNRIVDREAGKRFSK